MSDQSAELPPDDFDIAPVTIEDEMKSSYLDYAMSVIVSRALPDVRDGLKPVHRRILYSMKESGFEYNRPYRKSARIVGEVMGKYHPHGDSAIYDAMVRMAQDFSMRLELIDGQGNFGSMDGDRAAAMRYTEARMSKAAHSLIADIDRNDSHQRIVRAAIAMAQGLDIEVAAEGVETITQLDFLKSCNCNLAQGFLISRPMQPEKISAILRSEIAGTRLLARGMP